MTLNLPNIYVHSINQQYIQLTKNKKEYEYTDNLINLYKTQFEKYDKIKSRTSKLAMNDEIANKLKNFVNNTRHTFDEKTLKLTTYLDNRITNENTWCIRNKLNYLGNDIYYVQYKNGKCFFGCKITENSNKIKHYNEILERITNENDRLKKDEIDIQKNIIQNDLYLLNIKKTFMVNN